MQSWEYCAQALAVGGRGGKHRAWDSAKAPNSKYRHVGNLCNTAKEPSAVKGAKRTHQNYERLGRSTAGIGQLTRATLKKMHFR